MNHLEKVHRIGCLIATVLIGYIVTMPFLAILLLICLIKGI